MNVTIDLKASTWKEQVIAWLNTSHYGESLMVLSPLPSQPFFITRWYDDKVCCDWGSGSGWEWIRTEELIPRLQDIQQAKDS